MTEFCQYDCPQSEGVTVNYSVAVTARIEDMNQALESDDPDYFDELDADITIWDSELGPVLSVECNQCGGDLTELDPLRVKALELVDAKPWPSWRYS